MYLTDEQKAWCDSRNTSHEVGVALKFRHHGWNECFNPDRVFRAAANLALEHGAELGDTMHWDYLSALVVDHCDLPREAVERLRAEARQFGDDAQVALCDRWLRCKRPRKAVTEAIREALIAGIAHDAD